jgi:hypothetical protein
MGISDKSMADAIAKRDATEAINTRLTVNLGLKERIAGTKERHTVGWTDPRLTANAMIAPPPVNSFQGGSYAVTESDLQNEAMLAPLSAVIDMWTVRWGGEWVAEKDLLIDNFWRLVLLRLLSVNKVEKHYKMNQQGLVYRIIE